jgi:hypothetical protein
MCVVMFPKPSSAGRLTPALLHGHACCCCLCRWPTLPCLMVLRLLHCGHTTPVLLLSGQAAQLDNKGSSSCCRMLAAMAEITCCYLFQLGYLGAS